MQERLAAVFLPLMAARKQSPGDDLISTLVTEGSDGSEALSDPLIFGFLNTLNAPLGGLAPAGVANSVALIGAHPNQQAEHCFPESFPAMHGKGAIQKHTPYAHAHVIGAADPFLSNKFSRQLPKKQRHSSRKRAINLLSLCQLGS